MNRKYKSILLMSTAILVSGLILWMHFNYQEELVEGNIIIGVPNDAGGLVVDYLMREKQASIKTQDMFGIYTIRDCCSSTAEWALSGNRMHMAIICPDAAERLIEKDNRYSVVGPILANSDMIVLNSDESPRKIGITQNRWYQQTIAEKVLGEDITVIPMLPTALPYAYIKGEVQGIVVDMTQGLYLNGEHLPGHKDSERVTYVLVARKGILNKEETQKLLELWKNAAAELQESSTLQHAIDTYMEEQSTGREAVEWMNLGMKFMNPLQKTTIK